MWRTSGVWYMGLRTSIYLTDDLNAAVQASAVALAEFARRSLAVSTTTEAA